MEELIRLFLFFQSSHFQNYLMLKEPPESGILAAADDLKSLIGNRHQNNLLSGP
jgi:hypothetical protein